MKFLYNFNDNDCCYKVNNDDCKKAIYYILDDMSKDDLIDLIMENDNFCVDDWYDALWDYYISDAKDFFGGSDDE